MSTLPFVYRKYVYFTFRILYLLYFSYSLPFVDRKCGYFTFVDRELVTLPFVDRQYGYFIFINRDNSYFTFVFVTSATLPLCLFYPFWRRAWLLYVCRQILVVNFTSVDGQIVYFTFVDSVVSLPSQTNTSSVVSYLIRVILWAIYLYIAIVCNSFTFFSFVYG